MNPLRLAVHSLTAVTLLALGSACTSDTNPFDVTTTTPTTSEKTATIRLEFNVAETRASSLTFADEENLTYVSVYVFDDKGNFEMAKTSHDLSKGMPTLEVSVGTKTVYAIAGPGVLIPADNLSTIDAFEKIVFDSQVSNITNKNAFMMIGKSEPQSVYYTVEGADVPAANVFSIELVRLAAKTQVKMGTGLNTSEFGFSILGQPSFKVAQTCNKMQIVHQGTDIISSKDANNGSFEDYTINPVGTFEFISTGSFTAQYCRYMSENIVKNPTSGNTTFVVLSVPFVPTVFYTSDYNGNPQVSSTQPGQYTQNFYAVAIVDEANAYEDFTIDPTSKLVYAFQFKKDADSYAAALNGGTATAMTVAEDEAPMRAPRTRAGSNFQVVEFTQGSAYYRIDIKDGDDYKVERNKYYKITVNSIKSLGCHSENLLRPSDPNSALDSKPTGSAMIGASFKVKEWDEVDQSADID